LSDRFASARDPERHAILTDVGFDPNRPYNAKPFDYALVAICMMVAVGLLGWAFLG
jgi:hypothetical protein